MTPAINTAKKAKIDFQIHEYAHDPEVHSFGDEAADKLGISKDRVFKTLVVADEHNDLFVAVLPVSQQLNLKLFAKAIGAKKTAMAEKKLVERTTGYVLGGVSPIGQRKRLVTILHISAQDFLTIFVSAGKRGLQIELAPADLLKLVNGKFDSICDSI